MEVSAESGGEKWTRRYCSSQKILLVGEGDFSFALCLARAFGSGVNITATSLDSASGNLDSSFNSLLRSKYTNAAANLMALESLGCKILHRVDVHTMSYHPILAPQLFDRIVFNFPHAGWEVYSREDNYDQIRLHQDLVSCFFDSAWYMLALNGEIHVTHKTTYPFSEWRIKNLGVEAGLYLSRKVVFHKLYYPCYRNVKRLRKQVQ